MTSARRITTRPQNHLLTNVNVWSPDGRWIVYDTRTDPSGGPCDGQTIERVNVDDGRVEVLYRARHGAGCGVATYHPTRERVAFILGPEHPTPDWRYGPYRRHGVTVDGDDAWSPSRLDACDLVAPFTPGALRGGSHVHVWDAAGEWVSYTYEDAVLAAFDEETPTRHVNLRNVGVSVPERGPVVGRGHPRNGDGSHFSVLVTRTVARPRPGSDEIAKAFEDAWVGARGYRRADGPWQRRALAFLGHVVTPAGATIAELFVADLPEDLTVPGDGPLEGTAARRPSPPRGVAQRRITFTADRAFPGLAEVPRFWPRSRPDGAEIAVLLPDANGVAQLFGVSPNGGPSRQITSDPWPVASAFTWSPDGRRLAYAADGSLFAVDAAAGRSTRVTPKGNPTPSELAAVFSPDGRRVAFNAIVEEAGERRQHVFVARLDEHQIGSQRVPVPSPGTPGEG